MSVAKSNLANEHLQRAHFGTVPKHQPQKNSENPKIHENTVLGGFATKTEEHNETVKHLL